MGAIEIVCKSGMEEAKWHKGKGAYIKCARSLLDLFDPHPPLAYMTSFFITFFMHVSYRDMAACALKVCPIREVLGTG